MEMSSNCRSTDGYDLCSEGLTFLLSFGLFLANHAYAQTERCHQKEDRTLAFRPQAPDSAVILKEVHW